MELKTCSRLLRMTRLESNPKNSDPESETLPTGQTALVLLHAILLLGPGLCILFPCILEYADIFEGVFQ